jgi:SNF2 family DNA or RNA helicase
MVKNPSTDAHCKTTLILAPTALIDQWKNEVEDKTDGFLKVGIYHGTLSLLEPPSF